MPQGGEIRIRSTRPTSDPKSYYLDGNEIGLRSRSLGIKRNAIVLPLGYELVSCNVPSQVLTDDQGRISHQLH